MYQQCIRHQYIVSLLAMITMHIMILKCKFNQADLCEASAVIRILASVALKLN